MSSREMETPVFTCYSCKKKRRTEVQLNPCKINDKLILFLCSAEKCLYPLNSRNLHKFIFKRDSPESELKACNASEVPSMADIFLILVKKNQTMVSSKPEELPEKLPGTKETSSAPVLSTDSEPVDQDVLFIGEGVQEQIEKNETDSVFLMRKNKDAFCWMHSTLCLLVHSKKLKHYFKCEEIGDCHVKEISMAYDKAVLAVNSENLNKWSMRSSIPVSNLEKLRKKAFDYLQPLMRCERGQEESPIFAIIPLLRENKSLHNLFLSKCALELKCENCGYKKVSRKKMSLISIPSTVLSFNKSNFTYTVPCIQCNTSGQKITLQFVHLPPLLLMHFVNGLPSNNMASFDFQHDGQMYAVRGFVQYSDSSRHFVSWIRSDEGKLWMRCDDLSSPLENFATLLPAIPASEIRVVMWETSHEMNLSVTDSSDIHISESTSPPLITLEDSDCEDHQPFHVVEESNAASQEFELRFNTDFNKSSSTPCPEALSPADSHSDYLTDNGSVPYGSPYNASERNNGEELLACVKNASCISKQRDPPFQRKKRELSSKEVCPSIDESHFLGKEDSTESNYMPKTVVVCVENLPIQKTKKVTHNTLRVPSSSESLSMSACNAQFQNRREEVLQPNNNFKSKSVLEEGPKAVPEVKVSSANEKSESRICDVTSDSKNKAGVGESKNLSSPVDFKSVTHAVERYTDSETNANGKFSRGENVDDSSSLAVEDMSRSNHETSKIDETKIALHFRTTQHSEHSYATSFFESVPECYVIADRSEVETYAEKHGCKKRDSNKDRCCQSTTSSPKTSLKAQSHDDSKKATFPVGKNDVETASSGKLNDISIGVVMSPSAHSMPFKKTPRKPRKFRSPSTEQTERSVASSPVSGHVSCIAESKTENIVDTGKVSTRRIKRYKLEHKSTGENTVKTDSSIPVTSDAFTSNIITMDQSVGYSVKEKASVHPETVLNDSSHTKLDSLASNFEMENSSSCEVIPPISSDSLFTASSADDSASSGNRANASDAVIQHKEDLKVQQPNNLGIPSVKDAVTELKTDSLRQMCRSTVSSVTDLEENKDSTQLCGSDLQKTPINDDPSNTALMEVLSNILALRDLCQVTDQNLDASFTDTTSNNEDINGHTAADGSRSFCSVELASPKHSTLNKKKPCAKVIGQRKASENAINIPEQVAMNENETSKLKEIGMKNKPDEILEPDNDVLLGSCFQSKSVVNSSRHLQNSLQEESINFEGADSVCKQKMKQKCEPDSVNFKKVSVDTQPSVPECHIKDGVNKVNSDRSCSDDTNLKSNKMHLRVTEANSPKPSSGGTDAMKSKASAQSISTAKTRAKSKALALKTSKVSPNAKENMLIFENIIAVFHHNTEDVVSEHANKVSAVPCPVGKSKRGAKKKQEKDNSFAQVCFSTSDVDLKELNKPVTSARRRTSKRQRKSAFCNEVMAAGPEEPYVEDREFYVSVKSMIYEHNACPRVLNESQKSVSASPEKDLGVVDDCPESVSICGSASLGSTIGQKSRGRKRKCSKDKAQNEVKSPSLPENSSEPGTAEGSMSEKKKRLRMKNVRFKIDESKSSYFLNEEIKTVCSPSKKVSQPDILEDQNATTQGETQFSELKSSLSSGNNSIFSQIGDEHPAQKKLAAAKDNIPRITEKSSASILRAQGKRQSNKDLSPKPTVAIRRKGKGSGDAVVKNTTRESQPGKPSAVAHSENQHAASNNDISSPKKKSSSPKMFPFLLSVPLQYSQEDLSLNFQVHDPIPHPKVTSIPRDKEFSVGLNK